MISITATEELSADLQALAVDGLNQQAFEKKAHVPMEVFALEATDGGKPIGCVKGITMYGGSYVNLVFVDSQYRGQSIGRQLMDRLDELMKKKKVRFITLTTMDFEAKPFYEKCGYKLEFERSGYDNGSVCYYLIKHI